MRSLKGSRRIVVEGIAYRWRATGNDGHIVISIWPTENTGPAIHGNFAYHETWIHNEDGRISSLGNQIVVTTRLVRRIIEHAKIAHQYNSLVPGKPLDLGALDKQIEWQDVIRATKNHVKTTNG